MDNNINEIGISMKEGNLANVLSLTNEALNNGVKAETVLDVLLEAMGEIGVRFKNNEVFVPEVLIAARAMNGGIEVLKPLLIEQGVESIGKVIIGTVKGDLHDIGKNLVKMMMIGAGFEVIDLGVDVTAEKYIDALIESEADILCMSALLTTTMTYMKSVIEVLEEKGIRDDVKVMIGGAPITEKYAEEIGADKYTPDAASAAEVAKLLISN